MNPTSTLPKHILFLDSKTYTYKEFHPVALNHDLLLEDRIAEGGYGAKTPIISSSRIAKSDLKGTKYYSFKLFIFLNERTTTQIKDLIQKDNAVAPWKIANLDHLLAFGAEYPDEQIRGPIVALGTSIILSKSVNFPMLQYRHDTRALSVTDEQIKWEPAYSFLAYR